MDCHENRTPKRYDQGIPSPFSGVVRRITAAKFAAKCHDNISRGITVAAPKTPLTCVNESLLSSPTILNSGANGARSAEKRDLEIL